MKKIIFGLVIALISFTSAQAQKKGGKNSLAKHLKKMTADFNLTEDQKAKIKPILLNKIADRKAMMEERRELRAANIKPSKEARKEFRQHRIEKETAINKQLSKVLTTAQYAKYLDLEKDRKEKTKSLKGNIKDHKKGDRKRKQF